MRVKVSCAGIVDRAMVPQAVIVADVKVKRGADAERYVLLSHEERVALSDMSRASGAKYFGYAETTPCGLPSLVRSHHWDAAGKIADNSPISTRRGTWSSGEHLWVASLLADGILYDFYAWRDKHPPRGGAIWAPSWLALVAAQSLALAAGGLRVPRADDVPADDVGAAYGAGLEAKDRAGGAS